MTKTIIMMSGIPRSGSSVLCSLLNQHPRIYASTTSPLIEFINDITPMWDMISARMYKPHPDQYVNMVNGLIYGTYNHVSKDIIVDKNRLWPRHAPLIKKALGHNLKIICTVRPIPEIIASYVTLINKNKGITFIDSDLIELNLPINTKNRCRIIWEKYIHTPYTSLRKAYNSKDIDICTVSYDDIVNNSQQVMDTICEFIGVESIAVNLDSLQPMKENDKFHGGIEGLHDVRPVMKRISSKPEDIIGKDMVKLYTDMKLEFWNK